jgi:hypothetical protein
MRAVKGRRPLFHNQNTPQRAWRRGVLVSK